MSQENREFTLKEIQELSKQKDSKLCLVGLFGKVYNLHKFLASHPGGERVLIYAAGDIIDDIFEDGNHRALVGKIPKLLSKYEYGTLKL